MNLTVAIESAELKYRQILEDFFVSAYTENKLPSHGIDHHRRVWRYAKELLLLPGSNKIFPSGLNPAKLIIACYLHDAGMSAFPGPRHGRESRKLCQKFLKINRLARLEDNELLDAIEYHDIKEYKVTPEKNDILKILSMADDLDAYGHIGIYRYSEVNIIRGTDPAVMGDAIIDNARKRFNYFQQILGSGNDFVSSNKGRLDILTAFFSIYSRFAVTYDFSRPVPEGYCGVIQVFMRMVRNKWSLAQLFSNIRAFREDIVIRTFFENLKQEFEVSA